MALQKPKLDWTNLFEACPDIAEDIVKSLNLESVLTCRLVCKFWRDSISANKQLKARIKHTSVLRAVKMGPLSTNVVSRVADVNKIYQTGMTPLVFAVLTGRTEVVEILISHGADINQTDTLPINRSQMKGYVTKTPLCHAAMKGHKDIAELLIRKGANVNLHEPLLLALAHQHTCVAKLLISNGTNINQKKVWVQETFSRNELECFLCDGRAPVTALHIAVDNGDLEIVKLLIENKAALCARRGNQMCYQDPLHIALKRSNPEIAECLIRAGSNVNAVFMHEHFLQKTPLSMSLGLPPGERKAPDFKTANLLVEHGADINAIFNREALFGGTMLHHAVSEGNHEIVEFLVSHGADVNIVSRNLGGEISPIELALSYTEDPQHALEPKADFARILQILRK